MILHTVIDPMEVMGSVPPQFVWKKIDGGLLHIRKDMTGGKMLTICKSSAAFIDNSPVFS